MIVTNISEPTSQLNTAVLFLVFNRPAVTRQVFEAIRKAKPTRLYVAADGARKGKAGESELCAEVRRISTSVDWPCDLKILFRDQNLGCKFAVSEAITWFFCNEEQGIVLEDDCLPSQSFFWYSEFFLNYYKNNLSISAISGNLRSFDNIPDEKNKIFKSKYFNMWGWASWRRAWSRYDVDFFIKDKEKIWPKPTSDVDRYWTEIYKKMKRGLYDTWDYQMMYMCFSNESFTIYPKYNMVSNLGFGNDATHCSDIRSSSALRINNEWMGWVDVEVNEKTLILIDEYFEEEYKKYSIGLRVFNKVKNIINLLLKN